MKLKIIIKKIVILIFIYVASFNIFAIEVKDEKLPKYQHISDVEKKPCRAIITDKNIVADNLKTESSKQQPCFFCQETELKDKLSQTQAISCKEDVYIERYCKEKTFFNYAGFSLESYYRNIRPILLKVNTPLANEIDILAKKQPSKNSLFFARYLFFKLYAHQENITEYSGAISELPLNEIAQKYSENNFQLSKCRNYFIAKLANNKIILSRLQLKNNNLQILASYTYHSCSNILVLEFTPKNNIVVSHGYDIASYKIESYEDDSFSLKQLWCHPILTTEDIDQYYIQSNGIKIYIDPDEKNFIATSMGNKSMFSISPNNKVCKTKICDMLRDINFAEFNNSSIRYIIVNEDLTTLAIVKDGYTLQLFKKDKYKFFREENIPDLCNVFHNSNQFIMAYFYHNINPENIIKLNANGNLCVILNRYPDSYQGSIIVLKKICYFWNAIEITGTNILAFDIMPDSENIITLVKRQIYNGTYVENIEIISIDNNLFSNNPTSINNTTGEYTKCYWLKKINLNLNMDIKLSVHPSGLYAFITDRKQQVLKIITISKQYFITKLLNIFKELISY